MMTVFCFTTWYLGPASVGRELVRYEPAPHRSCRWGSDFLWTVRRSRRTICSSFPEVSTRGRRRTARPWRRTAGTSTTWAASTSERTRRYSKPVIPNRSDAQSSGKSFFHLFQLTAAAAVGTVESSTSWRCCQVSVIDVFSAADVTMSRHDVTTSRRHVTTPRRHDVTTPRRLDVTQLWRCANCSIVCYF